MLTDDARYSLFRRKLLEHVEGIIAASVKPMEKIGDIKIMQLDGITAAAAKAARTRPTRSSTPPCATGCRRPWSTA